MRRCSRLTRANRERISVAPASWALSAEQLGATIPTIAALLDRCVGGVTGSYILKRVDTSGRRAMLDGSTCAELIRKRPIFSPTLN
jgi:hypothetical protein